MNLRSLPEASWFTPVLRFIPLRSAEPNDLSTVWCLLLIFNGNRELFNAGVDQNLEMELYVFI